ncbi:hypothetical protein J3Q64DRAFT_1706626 [Phycomyces blakesleeanus]|uniref:histone deacetylase n=1 Tax=Phycomyces blakesleeanus TaxID=4837 RepID=A0ABR3BBF0_PHYBL
MGDKVSSYSVSQPLQEDSLPSPCTEASPNSPDHGTKRPVRQCRENPDLQRKKSKTVSYRVGNQVEVDRWEEDQRIGCAARVVEIIQTDQQSTELVFVHFEGWPPDQADWVKPQEISSPSTKTHYGPLGKESDESWEEYGDFYYQQSKDKQNANPVRQTGLVQDLRMSFHACPCHERETVHPEQPGRIRSILDAFYTNRMLRYFRRVHAREVTKEELMRVHTFAHVRNYYPYHTKATSIEALLNPTPPPPTTTTTANVTPRPTSHLLHLVPSENTVNTLFPPSPPLLPLTTNNTTLTSPNTPPGLIHQMTCGELGIAGDTTFHPHHSSLSARVSAGALIELSNQIVEGRLRNGFALIRPPGHHAEDDGAMGYCFFNNVAVAVASILETYPKVVKKVLIIDWDLHHGNGTQSIFYDNPNVLYISIHRWDNGSFYPFSGGPEECGVGPGLGRNVNIALSASEEKPRPMGDTEFVAAFHHIIIPIARQFDPDMIFVSAGYDAAEGHSEQLGGYSVTPHGFGLITKMVNDLAKEVCQGRLVLTLEGGYALEPLANSAAASVAQLLEADTGQNRILSYTESLHTTKPNLGAQQSFRQVVNIQKDYWDLPDYLFKPNYRFHLPSLWRATHSITHRPRRNRQPKLEVLESY